MRSLFLTSSALFLLAGGVALAGSNPPPPPPGGGGTTTTNTNVWVPVKNATADNGSSAATSGSTAVTANGNTLASNNKTDFTKTLTNVGNDYLSITKTFVHQDIKLATSSNEGSVKDIVFVGTSGGGRGGEGEHGSGGGSVHSGDASITTGISASSGINTLQQNTGNASLQQNSVALGSYVGGNGTGISGF
ncbi:MAG: hypothetical protein P4L52_06950 [Acidocella sp.]|nr:hypothetical protein [Acidocella sp.]